MQDRSRRLRSLTVWLGVLAVSSAACLSSASTAHADPVKPNVILPTVVIRERVPRPLAAVEISRVTTQKAIPLRAFSPLGRIESATRRAPF